MAGSPDRVMTLWGQTLEVHWPKAWQFYGARDVLLEAFTPEVFSIDNDVLFIRYSENQDLRISPHGLHIRTLTYGSPDPQIIQVLNQVLQLIKPSRFLDMQAAFSNVTALAANYDEARQVLARRYYSPWISARPVSDFALLWDEHDNGVDAHFELGVVNADELLMRVAMIAGMSPETLERRTPAWMKVRAPRVALFMGSSYITKGLEASSDIAWTQVHETWRLWRQNSTELFTVLSDLEASAEKG